MKRIVIVAAALGAVLLAGCGGESAFPEATGKGRVRAINAIPTAPQIDFLIEERLVGSADFKGATTANEYDDLDYTFNVEAILPSGRERLASQFLDVVADTDYTFVISGSLANPTITVTEAAVRTFEESDTVFEWRFAHYGETLGDVDIYLDAPGVAPALGQQVATLAPGDVSAPADYTEGDYVLTYTVAGDPGTVLLASDTVTLQPRLASTVAVFDADANEIGQISVRAYNDLGGVLAVVDADVSSTVRFHHISQALATADVYNDDPMMFPPIVTGHAFGDVTGDIPVAAGLNSLTYTGTGDTATILFEDALSLAGGSRTDYFVVGETDALSSFATFSDRRPVETFVKFSFLHAAFNHPAIDFYIVDADTDISDQLPLLFGVPAGTQPLSSNLQAGSFDLYVTVSGEKTVIAGPVRMDIALGDIVNYIALDNVDPAIADLVLIPLP